MRNQLRAKLPWNKENQVHSSHAAHIYKLFQGRMPLDPLDLCILISGILLHNLYTARGGASPEKVGWTRDQIDCQKVHLMFLHRFCLGINSDLRKAGWTCLPQSTPWRRPCTQPNDGDRQSTNSYAVRCMKNSTFHTVLCPQATWPNLLPHPFDSKTTVYAALQ